MTIETHVEELPNPHRQRSDFLERCNALGAEGWRLVQYEMISREIAKVHGGGYVYSALCIFQREAPR